MRVFLYDTLTADTNLQVLYGGVEGIKTRVVPRASQKTVNIPRPFIIYGLGNSTAERLVDPTDPDAKDPEGQFSQIWVHDESGDYSLIDDTLELIKAALVGKGDPAHNVLTTLYLETSQEFVNDTYNTIFRYARFQHIIAKGVTVS
jgi:hypothetical protein